MARARGQARDDFPQSVKDTLGRRVGYQCSRCYISTLGPTIDPHDSSNTGIAAHITAAAEGGPRYDRNLSSEERRAAPNGIWCCAICAKMIDDDDSRFTTPQLREMKAAAEHAADQRRDVAQRHAAELVNAEALSRVGALAILRQWRATYHYEQGQLIELDLAEPANASNPIWTVPALVAGLKRQRTFVVRGRPGAGKTMTLLQVADALAADNSAPVPLALAISAWAATGRDLAGYVADRLVAHGVDGASVPLLFRMGRLALLLNGWNEAAEADLVRVERLLKEFAVNFPGTPVLITTRVTESRPALVGETVLDVRPLSRSKKIELIRAAGLPDPDGLIAQVTGRPTLDRVTDTPLFLSTAIRLARSGTPLPETRSGLLQRFIEDVETNDDHRPALAAAPCHGFHRAYLAEIAATMTRRGRTTLTGPEVHSAIAECNRRLRGAGHLSAHGTSTAIADCLVRHHVLVLSPAGDGSHSFVHQQFQERFAADWLLDRIRELATTSDAPGILRFQQEILNFPQWGEALAFAVEDLVASGSLDLASALVRWTMPVDLVAAAELAGVGGPALWARVGADLAGALRGWYARDGLAHQDCALAGMVATGSPDFSDVIWPILESADEQAFFRPLRAYAVFRTSCLGPGWPDRLVRLSARRQEIFLGEMSRQSGVEELEFARRVAVSAAPAAVKNAAIELLAYRRHGAEAVALAQSADFGPWTLGTYHVFDRLPLAVTVPLLPRLSQELERERDPRLRQAIIGELHAHRHPGWLELAQREITSVAQARRQISPFVRAGTQADPRAALGSLVVSYAEMIGPAAPDWLEDWLVAHEAADLLWEHPLIGRVAKFSEDHLVALAEAELRAPRNFRSTERVRLLAGSGSIRVAEILLNAFLHPGAADRLDRRDLLREVPAAALAAAAVARAEAATSFDERVVLIEALEHVPDLREGISSAQQNRLRALVNGIVASIPADYPHMPHLRASLAAFLGRIGRPEDVAQIEALAATETARWEEIRREVAEARRTGRPRQGRRDQTGYANFYVGALAALGGPEAEAALVRLLAQPDWLGEAARGLVQVCRGQGLLPEPASPMERKVGIPQITPFAPPPAVQARANAIHAAIEAHRAAGASAQSLHRPDLIGAAGALALLHDPRAVELLLGANMQYGGWSVIEHLHLMAQRGAVLPGRRILAALEPFIAESEKPSMNSGHDPWYGLVKGFAMLLASDYPAAAVERMRRLPPARLQNYHGRDLFSALAACPKPEAAEFLVELSRTLPAEAASYPDLIEALSASPHPACRNRLLEMAVEPAAQRAPDALRRGFVQAAREDPAFGRALQERLLSLGERERAIFIASLRDLESEAAMLALLELPDLRPLAQTLHDMVREVGFGRVAQGSGGHHLVPRAANAVRQKLAGLLLSDSPDHRAIAASLLAAIQAHRLDYGQPLDEPLHPDATLIPRLAGPWPLTV